MFHVNLVQIVVFTILADERNMRRHVSLII